MTACLVSMGFDYAAALEDCLASIAAQSYTDLRAVVIDDASPDERCAKIAREWCTEHGHTAIVNDTNRGTVYNVWHGITAAKPERDDVVILIDSDDRWPHEWCVDRIMSEYEDPECWLTYGSYQSEPFDQRCPAVLPYPTAAIRERSFRGKPVLWNHPLSFKGFLWEQVNEDDLKRADGSWPTSLYDQWIMNALLEMAPENHRLIPDVIYLYNTTHPQPDNAAVERCEADYAELVAKPIKPRMFLSDGGLCMDWRDRCTVIEDYLTEYGIRTVVETGTADGATAEVVAASTAVDKWWTVEADRERFDAVAPRLRANPKIYPLFGSSPGTLHDIVRGRQLNGACLWWLDAHLPIEEAGHPSNVTPIVDELEIVFARETGDVVLVDDARLFGTYPGYPTLDAVRDLVDELGERHGIGYSMEVRHDIIRLVPTS